MAVRAVRGERLCILPARAFVRRSAVNLSAEELAVLGVILIAAAITFGLVLLGQV